MNITILYDTYTLLMVIKSTEVRVRQTWAGFVSYDIQELCKN
jgi:hypothetical protein